MPQFAHINISILFYSLKNIFYIDLKQKNYN